MTKILYAVQATGNGHISRAREIIPIIQQFAEVDVLLSGTQAEVKLPIEPKFKLHGLGYVFGEKGGINMRQSVNELRPLKLLNDVLTLPLHQYDLVINDFEPVSAWACKLKNKSCVGLSHQAAFLSKNTPRPEKINSFSESVLKNYAPTAYNYGFHFSSYDEFIYTPVIRDEVRKLEITNAGQITVYLPAHSDALLINIFKQFPEIEWHIFSKHARNTFTEKNIHVEPVSNEPFLKSMASSNGIITAGGFESVAEALFLEKKVLVIPMFNQYEQQCNATAAALIGVTKVNAIDEHFKATLTQWLNHAKPIHINYPDLTSSIIEHILDTHLYHKNSMMFI